MIDNIVVIIPSLNPDEKLNNTVNGMLNIGFKNILVVNDGSDKAHLKNFPKENEYVRVIHRSINQGKGTALKIAFRHILSDYPHAKGVVTVDGDGQHTPKDVLACAKKIKNGKNIAILGCRDFSGEDVPKRSRMGNLFTVKTLKLLCGIKISDTQTGLRAFPVSMLPLLLTVKGQRFEYETNMLLKLKQNGVVFEEVKIDTVYIEENKTSHFRPFIDSIRIYRFILSYVLSSMICFTTDIILFYIISKLLHNSLGGWTVITATAIARAFSSYLNYTINRRRVFDSNGKRSRTFFRYYTVAIPQMLVSAGLVSLTLPLFGSIPILQTIFKMIVDTTLFFICYRFQQGWVFSERTVNTKVKKKRKKKITAKTVIGRTFLSIFTAVLMVVVTAVSACIMICYGPSQTLRNMLVIMAKEASATKWVPTLFLPSDKVDKIIADSEKLNVDTLSYDDLKGKEDTGEWDDAVDGTKLIFLNESKFKGYLLLVKDPKRVIVGVSSSNFSNAAEGMRIFDMVSKYNCLAAINAGEFADQGGVGNGARPMGLTYSQGKNVWSDGLKRTFIGFDRNDRLICKESMTRKEADELGVRDAVSFQNGNVLIEQTGKEVKLYKADADTGTAQRTAIGQRADGTVIMLVTDGRAVDSIGATRNDVIDLMLANGAVNAAMLDGGSSAMMYYRNYAKIFSVDTSQFDMYQKQGLVNRYKAFTRPRRIPTYFIVTKGKK